MEMKEEAEQHRERETERERERERDLDDAFVHCFFVEEVLKVRSWKAAGLPRNGIGKDIAMDSLVARLIASKIGGFRRRIGRGRQGSRSRRRRRRSVSWA